MYNSTEEIKIPTIESIKHLLSPIYERLDQITTQMLACKHDSKSPKYYRNIDLKQIFNLSNNTIVKYRETGVLPYTKLGEIYLYEVKAIDAIIKQNSVNIDKL
jgi:hypothetical protein